MDKQVELVYRLPDGTIVPKQCEPALEALSACLKNLETLRETAPDAGFLRFSLSVISRHVADALVTTDQSVSD